MQKFKVNGQSVPKIEWKPMDGGDRITFHANAVGKNCDKVFVQC